MSSKKGLGRGVEALLPENPGDAGEEKFFFCDIDKIEPNPRQPRKHFDEDKLQRLADSIAEKGVIQPLLVSRKKGNRYNLIAGERRLRAARMSGLEEVPVVVMDSDSEGKNLELALIENIQRHDLNPIEEAMAYSRLINDFELTQEQVAQKVGRKRSTITNTLRLLNLPDYLQDDVAGGLISEGHARVLLRIVDDEQRVQEIRGRIIREELSVRETERLCRKPPAARQRTAAPKALPDELPATYCRSIANQLTNHLHTKVRIVQNGNRGKLEIEYYSSDDLDRLVSLFIQQS
ncbi:MAG: ParB/RepB/Spo0J family partition protein [Desulfobulbaceae bacterium]|jgi:ParB family chromosome partitioning protein|nr:ParB/RepB/Spo0J family partition protein [Desulfobulbaceae bacterium]MDY0349976.1 ParB/RepB/Spo0J family partition protein [Desulfobulbaceae bacterium]